VKLTFKVSLKQKKTKKKTKKKQKNAGVISCQNEDNLQLILVEFKYP
jgi:hypothetical protein